MLIPAHTHIRRNLDEFLRRSKRWRLRLERSQAQLLNSLTAAKASISEEMKLEAAPIGGQLFAHDNSQRDCTAF